MNFIDQYFLEPMGHYYTAPGTIVYAILFVIAVFFVYKYLFPKLKLKIDKKFMISLLPFILLGGIMRSLEDAEFYQGFMFVSPGIYITLFFITLSSLLVSLGIQKYFKKPYWYGMLVIGSALLLYNLVQVAIIGIANWTGFSMVAGLLAMWALIFFPVMHFFPRYLSRMNYLILLAHLLDASASFIATTYYSYMEQHVLPGFLFSAIGPWVMFPLKIVVVWPILYMIDKYIKEDEFRTWMKIAVLILGLALGTRDLLSLSMLV